MSQAQGIPLTQPTKTNKYRLIELPFGLDTLLTSAEAPRLTLHSTDDSAILKTPSQAYTLRQKNTSNALIILKPGSSPTSSASHVQTLEAVGTVHETIELEPFHEKPTGGEGTVAGSVKHTGSKGKWHEKFGRGR